MPDALPPESRVPTPERSALAPLLHGTRHPVHDDAPSEVQAQVDWGRWWTAIVRKKWLVLGMAALGAGAGVAASRFLKPVYATQATLWVDVPVIERQGDQGPNPIQSAQLLGPSGWADLLQSHAVLDDVVDELRLYLNWSAPGDTTALDSFQRKPGGARPGAYRLRVADTGGAFTLATQDGVVLQNGHVGDSVGAALGFSWVPPASALTGGREIEFTVESPPAVALKLASQMRIHTDLLEGKVGNFMTLELRGSDPEEIAAIVNATAGRFVSVAADLKREKLTELTKILSAQLGHAQENLRNAEAALRSFRVRSVTRLGADAGPVTPNTQFHDPVFAGLVELKVTAEQLRRDRQAIEGVLSQASDSGLSVDALTMIESVQRSLDLSAALKDLTEKQAELRALRFRYTEDHPPLQRRVQEVAVLERRTIPVLARRLMAALAVREAALAQRTDSTTSALQAMPPLAIEDARVQREVTFAEQLAANIQQRYTEAQLAEVSTVPDVRVLDAATVPLQPLYNLGPILVAVAVLGSLGVGMLGAVVIDRADRKLRYPHQVTRALGLPILGAVPHVARSNGGGNDGAAAVIEAVRGVRLSLTHAHGAGPVIVTITSPGRSDGKSFIASNLALAFADAGYSTLLIDGDIRRGALHRVLKAARKPGLTDALAGDAAAEAVVQQTRYPGLAFMGCGTRRHRGPELLCSPAMTRLLTGFRSRYAAILVDSAPLAAGVDAYELGTITGAMLLVLRTGVSNRELAEAKLEVLDRLPVRMLGAVLNDVRLAGDYRYYSYYLTGYELGDEDEARQEVRTLLRGHD